MAYKKLISLIMAVMLMSIVVIPAFAAVKAEGIMLGDVNNDGTVNTGDATFVLKYCSSSIQFDDEQLIRADANNDGAVNTADATYILRIAAGMEQVIILDEEPAVYTVSYTADIPCELPVPEQAAAGTSYVIQEQPKSFSEEYQFKGWLLQEDGTNIWRNYVVGQSFVMPEHDVTLSANFVPADDADPTAEPPTTAPTYEPTGIPTATPTNEPTGEPTQTPTETPPTEMPTDAPTGAPTETPTEAPTAAPTPTAVPGFEATILFYPGDNSENGGGVKDADTYPLTQIINTPSGIVDKHIIPHSVTLSEGVSNAYAFTHWTDDNGNMYYPGDRISVENGQVISLTANWESGYQVLMSPADIEQYVFDDLDNKVILGNDIVLYYYNTEYFFPIGFDSDSPYNDIQYKGAFTGKFDGAGYTICNLTCEYASSDICSAFFYINEGTVSNFTFKLNQLYSEATLLAGIACTNKGTIRNVDVTWYRRTGYHYATDLNADISSLDITRGAKVGGLVAHNSGLIANCDVDELTLKVCHGLGGGICAYNDSTGIVSNCNSRNVKITFVYDPENYEVGGYEVNGLIAIDIGTTMDSQATGFIKVLTNTFWEENVSHPTLPAAYNKSKRKTH